MLILTLSKTANRLITYQIKREEIIVSPTTLMAKDSTNTKQPLINHPTTNALNAVEIFAHVQIIKINAAN